MEQKHEILKNRLFTSTTTVSTVSDNLELVNNYYLNPTGEIEKIVDYTNVRGFLSNENNQKIVNAYYSYLTSSTEMNESYSNSTFKASAKFKAIYYDDEKLADSFNEYYNSIILRGAQNSSIYISGSPTDTTTDAYKNTVNNQLLGTQEYEYVTQNVSHNNFYWKSNVPHSQANSPQKPPFPEASTNAVLDIYGGDRILLEEQKIVEKPLGENYFVNVFLQKRHTQIARIAFEACNKDSIFRVTNNNSSFSQNVTDKIRHNDFLSTLEKKEVGIDGYEINDSQQTNVLLPSQSFGSAYNYSSNIITSNGTILYGITDSEGNPVLLPAEPIGATTGTTGNTIIQCFVDPNFKTNANEYWTNYFPNISFELSNYILQRTNLTLNEEKEIKIVFSNTADESYSFKVKITYLQGSSTNAIIKEIQTNVIEQEFIPSAGATKQILTIIGLANSLVASTIKLEITDYGKFIAGTKMSTLINVVPPIIPPKRVYFNPFTEINGQQVALPTEEINGRLYVVFSVSEMPDTQQQWGLPIQVLIDSLPSGDEYIGLKYSQSSGSIENGINPSIDWYVSIDSVSSEPTNGILNNTLAWTTPGQSPSNQIKNLLFHIENNEDNVPGADEYILVELLYDTNHANTQSVTSYNDNFDFSGVKIIITDSTAIPPNVSLCSLPDFYYINFSDSKYDNIDESVLSYYKPDQSLRYLLREDFQGNVDGPRFKEYINGYAFDIDPTAPYYGLYSDTVQFLPTNYTIPSTNNNIFVLRGLDGSLWELAGKWNAFGIDYPTLPTFPTGQIIYTVNDKGGQSMGTNQIFWRKRSETETICNSVNALMGRTEIIVSGLNNSQINEVKDDEIVTTYVNGQVETSADVELILTDSSGNIIIGPPNRKFAAQNPNVVETQIQGGGSANIVRFTNCSIPINFSEDFYNYVSGWDLYNRFLVKAGVQPIIEKTISTVTGDIKISKVSVYYFINGLRKSWETDDHFYDGIVFKNKIQRARRVDENGDVWEWAYRVVSPIISQSNIDNLYYVENGQDSHGNDIYTKDILGQYFDNLNGWGWYKMMNINSSAVYDNPGEMINENLENIDGHPLDVYPEENPDPNENLFPPDHCVDDTITNPHLTSAIDGDMSPLIGSTQTYSVDDIYEINFVWDVPIDWTIVDGQGTNSINVNVTSTPGVISVIPQNADGTIAGQGSSLNVTPSTSQVVTLYVQVNSPNYDSGYPFFKISINNGTATQYLGNENSINILLNSLVKITVLTNKIDGEFYDGMSGDITTSSSQLSAEFTMDNNKNIFINY